MQKNNNNSPEKKKDKSSAAKKKTNSSPAKKKDNSPAKKKNIYHFAFYYGKDPLIYQQRDCPSFIEVAAAFSEKDSSKIKHVLKGSIPNFPTRGESEDMPLLGPDDLILLTTRPALDENDLEDMKPIRRSYSRLEIKLFDALRPHLSKCSRKDVHLNVRYRNKFRKKYRDRCQIEFTKFSQRIDGINFARYLTTIDTIDEGNTLVHWNKKNGIRTAGYLIYLPEAWKDGPALLSCFSLTASFSLLWSFLVKKKFSYLLDKPVIAMAEIILGNSPKQPKDLSFVLDWDVQLLLETEPIVMK